MWRTTKNVKNAWERIRDDASIHTAALRTLILKTTMFSPRLLADAGVPVYRVVQRPGEFIVTFPRCYHAGFSHGFNVGEAVNIALPEWFPMGRQALARYSQVSAAPIIPHEQLLCREIVAVGAHMTQKDALLSESQLVVTKEFLSLVENQRKQRMELINCGAKEVIGDWPHGSKPCASCQSLCYLAMVSGNAVPAPICLNCATKVPIECSSVSVSVRSSLLQFENLAGHLWCHKLAWEHSVHTRKYSCPNKRSPAVNHPKCKRNKLSGQEKENMGPNDRPMVIGSPTNPLKEIHKNGDKRHSINDMADEGSLRGLTDQNPGLGLAVVAHSKPIGANSTMPHGPKDYPEMCPRQPATNLTDTRVINHKRRFHEFLNSANEPLSIVSRDTVEINGNQFVRTVLECSDRPDQHCLIAEEVLDAGGIPKTPDPQTALSRILCKADELSEKLGTIPIDEEPIKATYIKDNGQVKDCLLVGRGEMNALLLILVDKAFIRVGHFPNKIWPQSFWNSICGD